MGIRGQSVEDSLIVVCRWNQSMRVVLEKPRNGRKHLPSILPRIEKLPDSEHGRYAASDHIGKRELSAKHWVRIWKPNPSIGKLFRYRILSALKMPVSREIRVKRS